MVDLSAESCNQTMSVTTYAMYVQPCDVPPSRWTHTAVALGTQTLNMAAVCSHLRVTTLECAE